MSFADGFFSMVVCEIFSSIVICPKMMDHPAGSVAERSHVPATLPHQSREFAQGLVPACRRKTVRINPGARPLPRHDDSHKRHNPGVGKKLPVWLTRPHIELTLDSHDEMGW